MGHREIKKLRDTMEELVKIREAERKESRDAHMELSCAIADIRNARVVLGLEKDEDEEYFAETDRCYCILARYPLYSVYSSILSVRGVRARSARISIISLSHIITKISSISLKSMRVFLLEENHSDTNARTQVRSTPS